MIKKIIIITLIFLNLIKSNAFSEIIKDIKIKGNDRISSSTIILFSDAKINENVDNFKLNEILKNLYETNFFDDISVNIDNNELIIVVDESPIIDNIKIEGIKAKKYIKAIENSYKLRPRNSFNKLALSKEIISIKTLLKSFGFYFAQVTPYIEELDNNSININYSIDLGERAKISKISFIGDKVYKDRKLRNILVSEESKFWKFISNKKFLNEELIEFDKRLLKNFYLKKGYYNVKVNSSFARLLDNENFELIYNINAGEKIYFNNIKLNLPIDFKTENYSELIKIFSELKGKPYSIFSIEKILDEIDLITLDKEYQSVKASVQETIVSNKLDITINIEEAEKYKLARINIFGNDITKENVIRNNLEIDEGGDFNEILVNKSKNNLKNLNFFQNVTTEVLDGKDPKTKIVNISVEEKPTGEISAGAGVGTSGSTVAFGVKENNYLGKGIAVDVNGSISAENIKGKFMVTNPNFKNTDKSVFFNIQALEVDKLKKSGFKTNKTGFAIGTNFEQYEDLILGISTSSFYEKIETNSTASARQRKQTGDYWDTFLNLDFIFDKRNQKFRTSDGYISKYNIDLPIISDNNTLTNSYEFKFFSELYEDNISSFSVMLKSANSITGDDVKLTERLNIPSRKLRGFESGKVGPKDGNDFIGGNYITSLNFNTTVPQLFPNLQNLDALLFLDAANIWGVDYDSSIDDSSKIRSSFGIGIDWHTILGPLSFSLAEVISKTSTDVEESFRFNIGTTF